MFSAEMMQCTDRKVIVPNEHVFFTLSGKSSSRGPKISDYFDVSKALCG